MLDVLPAHLNVSSLKVRWSSRTRTGPPPGLLQLSRSSQRVRLLTRQISGLMQPHKGFHSLSVLRREPQRRRRGYVTSVLGAAAWRGCFTQQVTLLCLRERSAAMCSPQTGVLPTGQRRAPLPAAVAQIQSLLPSLKMNNFTVKIVRLFFVLSSSQDSSD